MDDFKDERFKGIVKDPRFKKIPSKHTKTKLDKRVHKMFNDKLLNLGCKVDKRGLPVDHKITKDHQKLFQPEEGEQDETESSSEDENSAQDVDKESDDDLSSEKIPQADGSDDEDGSTSTDTEISDDEQEEEIDHHWQELDADAPRAENITRRLAVCNMDWDRLRAEDFFVVFNSFKPADGVIHSIKIYPSEFGLERMEKEKLHGPAELINDKLDSTEDKATNDKQNSEFHREKLRQYQINRLKYYFAVVECDSTKTADALYVGLNGLEFESSGCILDLRFIPDDMTFDQEPVSVSSSVSDPQDYKPIQFVTSALNQIKVDLTWDETDPRRKEVFEKVFTDPESIEKDLKEYLASPSESSEDETELGDTADGKKLSCKEAIAKYKALLQSIEEKEKGQGDEEFDMEITWDSGLKQKTEELVKEKALKETLTPFEEELQKKKELKKMKKEAKITDAKEDDDNSFSEECDSRDIIDGEVHEKVRVASKGSKKHEMKSEANSETDKKKLAELALLVAEPDEKDSSDSDSMRSEEKKKKKKKMQKKKNKKGSEKAEDSVEGHIDDPRFAAMYTSYLYHVDPTEQKFNTKKETQPFKATQIKKSAVTPCEISKNETGFVEGSEGKGRYSVDVDIEALKKRLEPYQKKMESRKSEKQSDQSLEKGADITFMAENVSGSLQEANSSKKRKRKQKVQKQKFHEGAEVTFMAENVSGSLQEANSSKKRKRKQKVAKEKFREVDHKGHMSAANGTMLNSSATSYLEDNDDSNMLIFSSDSSKKQATKFSSNSSYATNSVRKKQKKNRVS